MQVPEISTIINKNLKKSEYEKYLGLIPNFKSEKAQKYTTILLSLGASIILGIFAVSPTISTIAGLQRQLEDDRFVEQKLQQKINNLNTLQSQYAVIANDIPLVFSAIPKDSQIPSLLAQIQGLAKESNVSLDSFQTFKVAVSKNDTLNKKYSSYDFGVKVKGDYASLLTFMDKLTNFQRIVTVNNVAMTKASENNTTNLQLNIKGSAYFKN